MIQGRFARNFNSLTREDQEKLGRSRVCILGLGGLGGAVCEMLARIGVGHLTLVDGDRFEASNLNRQILSEESLLGQPKAAVAKKRVKAINSGVGVTVYESFAGQDTIRQMLGGADLVVDCLDTIQGRFLLQDAAQGLCIPLVSGAIAGVQGQVTVIFPQDKGFELIYGPRSETRRKGVEAETGNLVHCALFVASLQVSEVVKILLNRGQLLRNKMLIADLWQNSIEVMALG